MTLYFLLKTFHGLLAAVLIGSALAGLFFAWRAGRSGDAAQIATTYAWLVHLELWFVGGSALLLPISGLALAKVGGWPLGQLWLQWSAVLYLLAALCWLSLLWLQVRVRNQARRALREGGAPELAAAMAWRLRLAAVALALLVAVYGLMVVKPL